MISLTLGDGHLERKKIMSYISNLQRGHVHMLLLLGVVTYICKFLSGNLRIGLAIHSSQERDSCMHRYHFNFNKSYLI